MSRILLVITLVILIGTLGFAALSGQTSTNPAAVIDTTTQTPTAGTDTATTTTAAGGATPAPAASGYTMAMVATHGTISSCWAAINGNVYDLTKWISQHPGGPDKILGICGTDGSAAFNGQHSGDHRPASELKNFLLGPLSK